MAIIVSVIQEKGGTGKSTIATNLVGIAKKGLKVALIDCDMPQGTSQSWAAMRYSGQVPVGDVRLTANIKEQLHIRLKKCVRKNYKGC
jgi:chromosome partitioning protein